MEEQGGQRRKSERELHVRSSQIDEVLEREQSTAPTLDAMEPPAGGGALLRRAFGRWRELTKADTSWQVVVGSTEHGTVGGWTSFSSSPSKKSSVTKLGAPRRRISPRP